MKEYECLIIFLKKVVLVLLYGSIDSKYILFSFSSMKQEEDIIDIPDDQENNKMEQQVIPINLTTGQSPFDVQFRLSAEALKQLPDANTSLVSRLKKFFEYNKKIQPGAEHFNPRREPKYNQPGVEPLSNQIVLFGSDFKRFKLFKKQYEPIGIRKMDDSNCKMIFDSFESAWQAILKNSQDPTQIVAKRQSQDDPIPRCWFKMKPYTHLQAVIEVFVRFATSEQSVVEPQKVQMVHCYEESKLIYNSQQSRLKDQEVTFKKEKIQIRQQKNSQFLYDQYNQANRAEWQRGKNENPGARRGEGNQRQRTREKKKAVDDDAASISYSMRSSRSIKQINRQLGKISLEQKEPQKNLDLSYEANPQRTSERNQQYNWNGQSQDDKRFSYRQYIEQQQREQQEEKARKKRVLSIVVID